MAPRVLHLLALPILGCGPRSVSLPNRPEAVSVVLAIDGTEAQAIAGDLDQPAALQLEDVDSLRASFFAEPLCALGLAAGRAELDPDGAQLTPIAEYRRDYDSDWEEIEIAPLGVRRVAPEECAVRGGSYSAPDLDRCVTCPMPASPNEVSLELGFDMGPCPASWSEHELPEEDPRYRICTPFAGHRIPDCAPGTWPFLGTSCEPLGVCPTDAIDLEDPTLIWVEASTVSGDGSIDRPYGTIAAALSDPRARTIAVRPGTYRERVDLEGGRRLVGLCAETTRIEAPIDLALATTSSGSAEDLTLVGPVYASGDLSLARVAIEGTLSVFDRLTAERIVVLDVLAMAQGSTMTLSGSVLRDSRLDGTASVASTFCDGGSIAEGGDVAIRESLLIAPTHLVNLSAASATVSIELVLFQSTDSGVYNAQLRGSAASDLTVRRSVFETLGGAMHLSEDSIGLAEDVLVLRTEPDAPPLGLIPSFDVGASHLEMNRCVHLGWGEPIAVVEQASLTAGSMLIRGALTGIRVEMATASISRSLIEDVEFVGVLYERTLESSPVSELSLNQTVIRRASPCLQIANWQAHASDVLLEDCRGASLALLDATRADLVGFDVTVRNTVAAPTNCRECLGVAIDCDVGTIEVDRFSIIDAAAAGIEIGSSCMARFRDGLIQRAPIGIRAASVPHAERILFDEVATPYQIGR